MSQQDEDAARKVFVGGLASNTKDEAFRELFAQFGELEEWKVMRDVNSRSARGYGFVKFKTAAAAAAVVAVSGKLVLGNRKIDCKMALDTMSCGQHVRKLFVGGLAPQVTSETLRTLFSSYGEVINTFVMQNQATGRSRCFGFVTFANQADAEGALGNPPQIGGKPLIIRKAVSRQQIMKERRQNPNNPVGPPGPLPLQVSPGRPLLQQEPLPVPLPLVASQTASSLPDQPLSIYPTQALGVPYIRQAYPEMYAQNPVRYVNQRSRSVSAQNPVRYVNQRSRSVSAQSLEAALSYTSSPVYTRTQTSVSSSFVGAQAGSSMSDSSSVRPVYMPVLDVNAASNLTPMSPTLTGLSTPLLMLPQNLNVVSQDSAAFCPTLQPAGDQQFWQVVYAASSRSPSGPPVDQVNPAAVPVTFPADPGIVHYYALAPPAPAATYPANPNQNPTRNRNRNVYVYLPPYGNTK
eukprot:g20059.t1